MKDEKKYKFKLNRILKTYDSILVKTKNIPKLANRNIIIVEKIEDLVNAQMEIRKPIYYFAEEYTCSFILFDENEVLIYLLKKDSTIINSVELVMANMEKAKNTIVKDILTKMENTLLSSIESNMLEDFTNEISIGKNENVEKLDEKANENN